VNTIQVRDDIVATYRRLTGASAAAYQRAAHSLAGGTTGNLRYFPPYPVYFQGGDGARMTDLDGRSYLDCFLCNGPMLLGHRHPAVLAEMARHERLGSLLVNPVLAVNLAELLQELIPAAARVRFLNSGTEAVMAATRYARAFTGKSRIIKFFGHYHGQDDQFLVGVSAGPETLGRGIPPASVSQSVLLPYGDLPALEAALAAGDVAAVILDPAMHAGGLWGSTPGYLRGVREATARHGALLIFDEVITGFRLALGGAQALYGVTPDLATFGKALGAGEKLAAVVGSEAVMRCLDPQTPGGATVFQSGTGNDGTSALAAALGAIGEYRRLDGEGGYARLDALGQRLAAGLRNAFAQRGVPCHVNQLGPMLQIFLSAAAPGFVAFSKLDTGPVALFYLALINAGVLLSLPTSNHIYLSFMHTEADIDEIVAKAAGVLDRYDFAALVATH
jgi:glutamate-1-semialdehyde 2,1-aminomutase